MVVVFCCGVSYGSVVVVVVVLVVVRVVRSVLLRGRHVFLFALMLLGPVILLLLC